MSLKKSGTENAKFLRVRGGKFFIGKDEQNPYDEVGGVITDIYLKDDEFDGKKVKKLYVVLEDESDKYILNVSFESSLSTTLIGFLKSADLSQPLSISPSLKKEKKADGTPIDVQKFFVRQNGQALKSFYTKDHPNGLPPMVQRKSGKWDKEDMIEFLIDVVEKELRPSVKGNSTTVFRHEPVEEKSRYATAGDVEEPLDDLPF
jgi:hypothetical protein